MRIRKLLFTLAVLSMAFSASGCSGCSRYTAGNPAASGRIEPAYVESLDGIESGKFYIAHDGKFYAPAWDTMNFEDGDTGSESSKVAWFDENTVNTIPTMYAGDYIVYCYSESFDESFNIDRFRYLGYTIGISNLEKTSSGRYRFDASSDNKNINKNSDANRLKSLNTEGVIIDTIGRAELRSGNVSTAGTIVGLTKDTNYKAEIYVGTSLKSYTVCADSIAFAGYQQGSTNNYTFLKSKIIRIDLPSYYNSGYYCVNGSGIFRYVNGDKYDSDTDFNVENDSMNASGSEDSEEKDIHGSDDEKSVQFVVQQESDVVITVRYEDLEQAAFEIADPVVKVIGTDVVYTVSSIGNNTMQETLHLPTGKYTLSISGMSGRAYDYDVIAKK